MRTTLDLPDPLFRELKAYAARHNIKLKQLLVAYIEAGLHEQYTIALPTNTRSPLPIARHANGKTIPALSNAQMQEILDEEAANYEDCADLATIHPNHDHDVTPHLAHHPTPSRHRPRS